MEVTDDGEPVPDQPYTVKERRAFHRRVAASIVVLYLATMGGFFQVERLRSHDAHQAAERRVDRDRQRAHDLRNDRRDARNARIAFLTSCAEQNRARRAIRAGIIGNNDDIGRYIVTISRPDRRADALRFAAGLHKIGVKRARTVASPVECTYPPRPGG